MSGVSFKRSYEISYYPSDEFLPSLLIAQGIGQTLSSDNNIAKSFAVKFEIQSNFPFYNSASKNTANMTIYNLKDETARAIQQPGLFNIALGYVGNGWVTDVFSGSMINATYGKEGNDRFLSLDLASGKLAQVNQIFEKSYGSGATTLQIVGDLVAFICEGYFTNNSGLQAVVLSDIQPQHVQVYTNPVSYSGDAVSILAQILPAYHVILSNKQVRIVPRKVDSFNVEYAYGSIFDLAPEYGEIFSAMTGKASVYDYTIAETGIDAKTILLPNLQVGDIVRLKPGKSDSYFDQYAINNPAKLERTLLYQVTDLVHSGNTWDGDYTTSFRAKFISQQTPITIDDTINLA